MSRIANLFRRRKLDRDLAAEIESHFEERVDQLVESGSAARKPYFKQSGVSETPQVCWSKAARYGDSP